MRRVLTTIAAAVVVLAMAGPARAQTVNFTANLSGNQEAPAPGVTTGAFGTATVTWNTVTQTLTWIIDVWNMPSGTNNAHFHVGGPGVAGPTVVNIAFPENISNDFRLTAPRRRATCYRAPRTASGRGRTSGSRWWAGRSTSTSTASPIQAAKCVAR